jgi:hypothetical protein
MRLHNSKKSNPEDYQNTIWELIPWYVNGSLPAEQAEEVLAYSKTCPACAAEIGRQQRLAKEVVKIDPFDVPLSRSWNNLRAQIEAEDNAKSLVSNFWQRFGWLQGGIIGLAASTFIAVGIVSIQPVNNDFDTLTSQNFAATQIIKFQVISGIDVNQITALLSTFDTTFVSGPSETGVYLAAVSEAANTQSVADALMTTEEIIFAAPEVDQ